MKAARTSALAITAVDRLAKYAGVLGLMRRRSIDGVTILMYHKILPESLAAAYPLRNLVVETSTFDRQMAWLSANFDVLTVRDAMGALDAGPVARRRPIACVTFDDGYRDNFDHAAPILEKHGLRGTFFVTSGFVEGTPMWFDRAACAWQRDGAAAVRQAAAAVPDCSEALAGAATLNAWMGGLKQLPAATRNAVLDAVAAPASLPDAVFGPLAQQQIRRLADSGHEIAAHSVTHPILTRIDDAALRMELEQSRAALTGWTGQPVDGFCYPNGDCDARVTAAARAAGYRYACAVRRGVATRSSDRMALPRRAIFSADRQETAAGFEAELVGWHDLLRRGRTQFPRVGA